MLKKLHSSKSKVVTSDIIASHPINSKEAPITPKVLPPVKEAPPKPAPEEKKPVKIRIRIPPLPANMAAASNASSAPGANVVPVGL